MLQKEAVCFSICSSRRKELIMVGSTGTVQNDGTLKNGGLKEKLLKDTSLQKQVGNTLASANEKRRHYFIRSSLVRNI
jgi:hypothetical protein